MSRVRFWLFYGAAVATGLAWATIVYRAVAG